MEKKKSQENTILEHFDQVYSHIFIYIHTNLFIFIYVHIILLTVKYHEDTYVIQVKRVKTKLQEYICTKDKR